MRLPKAVLAIGQYGLMGDADRAQEYLRKNVRYSFSTATWTCEVCRCGMYACNCLGAWLLGIFDNTVRYGMHTHTMHWYIVAALMMLFTTGVHAILGWREVMVPVLKKDLPPLVHGTLAVIWHFISVQFLGAAILFVLAASANISAHTEELLVMVAAGYLAVMGIIFFSYGVRVYGTPLVLPQWILLGSTAFFSCLGVGGRVGSFVALGVAIVGFFLIGLVHVLWATGRPWPAKDERALVRLVVGSSRVCMPPAWMSVVVAIVLFLAAFLVFLSYFHPELVPQGRNVLFGFAFVLLLRGVGGYFDVWLRPATRNMPFFEANRWFYSPLCLLLSIATGIIALA